MNPKYEIRILKQDLGKQKLRTLPKVMGCVEACCRFPIFFCFLYNFTIFQDMFNFPMLN